MQRLQAYKFELRPTGEQQRQMRRFSGLCRFVFNKALALHKERYEQGEKKVGYVRFPSTRMTGCFPHGECYNDPDVRFVNYFWDGRAVHCFPRLAYGFRQINGCVELPLKTAQRAYGLIHIGTPVTVMP